MIFLTYSVKDKKNAIHSVNGWNMSFYMFSLRFFYNSFSCSTKQQCQSYIIIL